MTDQIGEIPQSQALEEAETDSLSELFSRDPEGLSRVDRGRLVEALRAQRKKWASDVAAGVKPRGERVAAAKSLKSQVSVEDSGL